MNEIGKINSVLNEEDWDVISDNVKVALVGVAIVAVSRA